MRRGRAAAAAAAAAADDEAGEAAKAKEEEEEDDGGPTLVVCPSSAMLQWADEVRRATDEGSVNVVAYYGAGRAKTTMEDVQNADIVLTTYPVIEYEYRKIVETYKVQTQS